MTNFIAYLILILTFFNNVQFRGVKAADGDEMEAGGNTEEAKDTKTSNILTMEIDNDVSYLQTFLTQLQKESEILNKKVLIDDKEVSIHDFFNPSDSSGTMTVSKENVYSLSHIMNIVMSCEYSDVSYHYTTIIDRCFTQCIHDLNEDLSLYPDQKLIKINKCFTDYQSNLLPNIMTQISSIILSLANFMKLTKNAKNIYHEIYTILLSWYAFMYNNNNDHIISESYADRLIRLDSIMITNYQIKYRLERFMVKSCKYEKDLTHFKETVETNTEKPNEFFTQKDAKLRNILLPNVENQQNHSQKTFVMNTIDSDFNKIIDLIYQEVGHQTIQIVWNKNLKDLKQIFDYDIKTSFDLEKIFRYEELFLNIIYKLIFLHGVRALKVIKNDTNLSNETKSTECNNLWQKIIDFSEKLKDHYQPVGLINDVLTIANDFKIVCSYMQDITQFEDRINEYIGSLALNSATHNIAKIESQTTIENFFSTLSELQIYSKIHPLILNTFWEELKHEFPVQRMFENRYHYLQTAYTRTPVNNVMCGKSLELSQQLKNIEELLETSIENDEKNNTLTTNYSCFTDFNKNYNDLLVDFATFIKNTSANSKWAAILVTLLYNKKHNELFNLTKQNSYTYTHIRRLITFISDMKNMLLEEQYVQCSCGAFSDLNTIGSCPNGLVDTYWDDENPIDVNEIESHFGNIEGFMKYFTGISDVITWVLAEINSSLLKFKLYWDGNEKNVTEVAEMYKHRTLTVDDIYDQETMFAQLVVAIVYCGFMDTYNIVIKGRVKPLKPEEDALSDIVSKFKKVSLLQSSPIGYLFPDIILAINEFDNNNVDSANQTKIDFYSRSKFFGLVVEDSKQDGDITQFVFSLTHESTKLLQLFAQQT